MNNNLVENNVIERAKSTGILVEQIIPEEFFKGTKIFVVGPPRSGTTLIYSMIAKELFLPECTFVSSLMEMFDQTYKYSDDERFYYYGHNLTNLAEIFKKPIYDFLYTATLKVCGNSTKRFIYKCPILTRYLEYFQLFFENNYKIVFCLRDPRDTVSSMFRVFKKQYSEVDDNALFDKAIDFIFPFYNKYYDIINDGVDKFDKDKIFFIKYESILTELNSIQNLEKFLGFPIIFNNKDNKILKGKLDETSPFYSENYGKAGTTKSIGRYKSFLTSRQISRVEHVLSYYIERLNY